MTPWKHAESSAHKWGGNPEDYFDLHDWFDQTKQYTGDWTHRALRHHSAGIQWAIELFGPYLTNSAGQKIPIKVLAEQHVTEDCGFIPTPQDYLKILAKNPEPWMLKVGKTSKMLSMEIADSKEKKKLSIEIADSKEKKKLSIEIADSKEKKK